VLLSGPALTGKDPIGDGTRFVAQDGEAFEVESIVTEDLPTFPGDLWVWARNTSVNPTTLPVAGPCRAYLTSKE
jgi:hypothetical protein